jgi:hypothetical protein
VVASERSFKTAMVVGWSGNASSSFLRHEDKSLIDSLCRALAVASVAALDAVGAWFDALCCVCVTVSDVGVSICGVSCEWRDASLVSSHSKTTTIAQFNE